MIEPQPPQMTRPSLLGIGHHPVAHRRHLVAGLGDGALDRLLELLGDHGELLLVAAARLEGHRAGASDEDQVRGGDQVAGILAHLLVPLEADDHFDPHSTTSTFNRASPSITSIPDISSASPQWPQTGHLTRTGSSDASSLSSLCSSRYW